MSQLYTSSLMVICASDPHLLFGTSFRLEFVRSFSLIFISVVPYLELTKYSSCITPSIFLRVDFRTLNTVALA